MEKSVIPDHKCIPKGMVNKTFVMDEQPDRRTSNVLMTAYAQGPDCISPYLMFSYQLH